MVHTQDILESLDGIALVLDHRFTVVAGGWRNWARFWHENDGQGPPPEVLGRDLTGAFSHGVLRTGFRAAMAAVAQGERPALRLRFRCDGPSVRRDMRLTVAPCGPGHLLYHSRVLAETQLLHGTAQAARSLAQRCAVCAALAPADADALDWIEAPAGEPPLPASDTLCPRCALGLAAHAA